MGWTLLKDIPHSQTLYSLFWIFRCPNSCQWRGFNSCQWHCPNSCQWRCPNLSMTLSQLLSMIFSQLLSMTMSQLVNENVKDDGIDNSITLKMEMMIFLMMMMWWRMIIMKMMRMWITMAVVWTKILQSSVGVVPFNQVLRVYLSTLIKCRGR